MTAKKLLLLSIVLLCQFAWAQNKVAIPLNEVVVSDNQLKNFSSSQSVVHLNDSIINKNESLLTDLLNFNTVLYFKEYGRGMLSTVSFRGTTASQTAVIWNGININSQMNGSTDFNTISSANFNSISVKAGGGSVIYGSGAIGGTVHLNNDLEFKKKFSNSLKLDYGSFNTIGVNYKMDVANEKWSTQFSFTKNSSTNDYPYVNSYNWKGIQRWNQNGQYDVMGLNANFGYKINNNNTLKLYSQTSNTDRNISLISESEAKTKYINDFSRNLIEYVGNFDRLTTNLKAAYIFESYNYFPDIESKDHSFGETESMITKVDLGYQFHESLQVNGVLDYNRTNGSGSGFESHLREISSASIFAKQSISDKWIYEFGVRKEFTNNFKSPVLVSLGSVYKFSGAYSLKVNLSRNFRIPTYNDLYWKEGGNPNLKPESSYQAEVGNVFSYKKFTLSQTAYFIKINDLLRWIPGDKGIWSPQNTDRVNTYGTEIILGWTQKVGQNNFNANATYAYTVSENRETKKQLFFVPFNKATGSVAYSYKKFAANYQFLYNGFVFTRSDNDPNEIIKSYSVSNFGIDYDFTFLSSFKIGFQVLNVFRENYQSLENRIMPGMNFNMYLNLKF